MHGLLPKNSVHQVHDREKDAPPGFSPRLRFVLFFRNASIM